MGCDGRSRSGFYGAAGGETGERGEADEPERKRQGSGAGGDGAAVLLLIKNGGEAWLEVGVFWSHGEGEV